MNINKDTKLHLKVAGKTSDNTYSISEIANYAEIEWEFDKGNETLTSYDWDFRDKKFDFIPTHQKEAPGE